MSIQPQGLTASKLFEIAAVCPLLTVAEFYFDALRIYFCVSPAARKTKQNKAKQSRMEWKVDPEQTDILKSFQSHISTTIISLLTILTYLKLISGVLDFISKTRRAKPALVIDRTS